MKTALLTLIAAALVGCGASAEKEPTKADFAPKPKPAGFGPGGGAPSVPTKP